MTLDGIMLRGIFKHERLKPTVIRTSRGNVPKADRIETSNEYRYEIKLIFSFIEYDFAHINITSTSFTGLQLIVDISPTCNHYSLHLQPN